MKLHITISLMLISAFAFGQVNEHSFYNHNDYPDSNYSVKIDSFPLKTFKVELVQVKHKDGQALDKNSTYCRIWLTVKSGNQIIDKLFYPDCLVVGGCSGVYADGQPSKEYIILSKFGDNSGQLIIIDNTGKIHTYPGGGYSISDDLKYLFSIHDSDVSGLTIFDLSKNKLVFTTNKLKNELADFYKTDNKYFVVEIDDDETNENQTNILTVDFVAGKMIKSTVNDQYVEKANRLKTYNSYTFAPCTCGETK